MAQRKPAETTAVPAATAARTAELAAALEQFRTLLEPRAIDALQPFGPATVYTAFATVQLMIQQRLAGGASLAAAVAQFALTLQANPSAPGANKRVRERTLSAGTAAFSQARQRLRLDVAEAVARQVFDNLIAATTPTIDGRRAFLLDGTTLPLAPSPALRKAYPPSGNQHGEGVWPTLHLLVAHELESGCAMAPELGAKNGPEALGEAALACRLLSRLPKQSVLIADRNFGIFTVAHAAAAAGHDAVVRLTEVRFRALLRTATPVDPTDPAAPAPASGAPTARSWRLLWKPSRHDRKQHPELPAGAELEVWLHEAELGPKLTLWLAATKPWTNATAVRVYGRRGNVETDIRDVKITLNMEHFGARSPELLRKELELSLVAYNLVVQVRRLAAVRAGVAPRRLSFSGVWYLLRPLLLDGRPRDAAEWQQAFELTLRLAGTRKIPLRPGRNFARVAYKKRHKAPGGFRPPPGRPPK